MMLLHRQQNNCSSKQYPELQHVAVVEAMVEVVFMKTQYLLAVFLLCVIQGWSGIQ